MDIITMYLVFFFTCVGVDKNILKIKLAFICLFCPAHEALSLVINFTIYISLYLHGLVVFMKLKM